MLILTQSNQGLKGFHGRIGDPTNMFDSFGARLYVGDVVLAVNQDDYATRNKQLGTVYGLAFVCEEKANIANWTSTDHQYVMGLATIWDSRAFETPVDFDEDYWDALRTRMKGWIVHKMKDHRNLAVGERVGFLCVAEVPDAPLN